jgi:SPP1 family predicted phage head-tail adaptor
MTDRFDRFDTLINAGDLRTRITFQEPTEARDDGGAQVFGYANVEHDPFVWARWVNAHGQEAVQSDALKFSQRATVTVRYREDIQSTWRILKDGKAWQIVSIDHIRERRRWTEMIVERSKGTVKT